MNCKQFESVVVDALYQELDPAQQEVFDIHRAGCPDCASIYEKMSVTLDVMSRREHQDPGEQFWKGYYQRLETKMEPVKPEVRNMVQPWMLQVAATVVLLLTGFLIGRNYFGPGDPGVEFVKKAPSQQVPVQTADYRAQQFLDRSQVLLLGLIDLNSGTPDSSSNSRKQLSNDLILQADSLQEELKDPQHRRLRELVSELEIILLQIANLEEKNDLREIEMVKGGVDRKGILLKINIEQMRMSDRTHEEDKKANPHL